MNAFNHVEEDVGPLVQSGLDSKLVMDPTPEAFFGLPSSGQTSFGVLDRYGRLVLDGRLLALDIKLT